MPIETALITALDALLASEELQQATQYEDTVRLKIAGNFYAFSVQGSCNMIASACCRLYNTSFFESAMEYRKVFWKWSDYSGVSGYPVTATDTICPVDQYYMYSHPYSTNHAYGKKRREMMEFCSEYLKASITI